MKILVVPNSFKGSLSAGQVASAIKNGIDNSKHEITLMPMADGGKGTVECLLSAVSGRTISVDTTDPIGRKITTDIGIFNNSKTAIIEMAAASGLELIPKEKQDPLVTTTFGTGKLIKKAIDLGCYKIILGLGDSATNDGGAGALQALGAKLLDANKIDIKHGGLYLKDLSEINISAFGKYQHIDMTFLCDVSNTLLGPQGATKIYSKQKGASSEAMEILESNLKHFATVLQRKTGVDIATIIGSGAAGGLAAGLSIAFKSKFISGSDYIINKTKLIKKILNADLIVTGEGKLDSQTKFGKIPYKIAKMAQKNKIPVIGIFGMIEQGSRYEYEGQFQYLFSLSNQDISRETAMQNAYHLLTDKVNHIFRKLKFN
ncbi:MAG: glycerate kinase [Candidatus Cloacimonetes bacterium]|nr:glycerate kinase [Candidatus Cloacimonadota bacterium]